MTHDTNLIRVNAVLGSSADSGWAGRLRSATVDVLRLGQADAQKSRLRKRTSSGTEVAVSLDRGTQLRDGDVLHWDDQLRSAIVARIDFTDVMVIDLGALVTRSAAESMSTGFALGHALGNQHWAAVVKDLRVYVPLTIAREVMASVMKTHAFEHVTYTFVPGVQVASRLAPNEARQLFGAAGGHQHQHTGEQP
jgi:urease accessory protein